MILDLGVEALLKFEHNVCPLKVLSLINEFLEVIDSSPILEEPRCLQFGSQCLDSVLQAEVCHKVFYELPLHFI
jgi:hypothetical protein